MAILGDAQMMPASQSTAGQAIVRFDDPSGRGWHAIESFLPFLDATVLPSLGDLRAIPGARMVKSTLAREVVRIPAPDGGAIFAKRYRLRSTAEALKYTFLSSRAFAEWRMAHRLIGLGIPCAAPLAVAEKRHGPLLTEAFYFCVGLEHTEPFGGFVESRFRPDDGSGEAKLAILAPALDVLARLHARGIYHSDFHGGNLLARNAAPDPPQVFLIDLHSIHDPGAVFFWMRLRDLADLLFSLRFALSLREQLAAARWYGRLIGHEADVMQRIEVALGARARRHIASRSKRCFKNSTQFMRSEQNGWRAHHRRDASLAEILGVVHAHQREVEVGGPGVLSLSRRSRVSARSLGDRGVVVKEFLADAPARSRARRAYHAAHALAVRGLSVPQPIALVHGADRRAYVISEHMRDAVPLTYHAYRLARELPAMPAAIAARVRRELAEKLAATLASLVRFGVEHRDLSAKNILIGRDAHGALTVSLVDLEAVHFRKRVAARRLLASLVQLGDLPDFVSARDRLRFVVALERELPALDLRSQLSTIARRIDQRVFAHGEARRRRLV